MDGGAEKFSVKICNPSVRANIWTFLFPYTKQNSHLFKGCLM